MESEENDGPAATLNEKDIRIQFIADFIIQTYKLRQEKWTKCIGLDENRAKIVNFFEKPEIPQLIFSISASGAVIPSYEFPVSLKNAKAVYFIKKKGLGEPVSNENIKTALIYGDLSYSPLEQLSALVDEVSTTTRPTDTIDLSRGIRNFKKMIFS